MAQDNTPNNGRAKKSAPKKGWLKKLGDRIRNLRDTLDDRAVQRRHGAHADNLEKILARVGESERGKSLLAMAKENAVDISVVAPRAINGARGRFSRSAKTRRVRIASIGDIDLMTTTLWHELRHVEQHVIRGDMTGGTTRLRDTRRQHVYALMHEADAFTTQFMTAYLHDRAGQPQYLEKMLARPGAASVIARAILKGNTTGDTAQLSRRLFTAIMLDGLSGYQSKYFANYRNSLKAAATLDDYKKVVAKKTAPGFPDDARLSALYGGEYMSGTSLESVAAAFLRAQPKEAHDTLKAIETLAEKAQTIDEKEYKQQRAHIMKQAKTLSKAFKKAALKPVPEARKSLRSAARADKPPRNA